MFSDLKENGVDANEKILINAYFSKIPRGIGFLNCNLAGLQQPLFRVGRVARSKGKEPLFLEIIKNETGLDLMRV